MNYYEIGQRIRKYRKAYNLSQEQLADKMQILNYAYVVHRGRQYQVKVAEVLSVQADSLLFDAPQVNITAKTDEIIDVLSSCDT